MMNVNTMFSYYVRYIMITQYVSYIVDNGYSDYVFIKLFISEIIHTECSFLLNYIIK